MLSGYLRVPNHRGLRPILSVRMAEFPPLSVELAVFQLATAPSSEIHLSYNRKNCSSVSSLLVLDKKAFT